MAMEDSALLYKFDEYAVRAHWRVVDDIVMGGHSDGHFAITREKHGRFYGDVSLRDGGGFSSVRHRFHAPVSVAGRTQLRMRVRGDGSDYQLRLKVDPEADFSYVGRFATHGAWEEVSLVLAELYPVRRGKRLDRPNFGGPVIGELGFLIANEREQAFQLLIDRIDLI